MKYFVLAIVFLIAGCSTVKPCEPVTVNVPVAVSCVVEKPVKPVSVISMLPDDANDFDKIKALAIDYLSQAQYVNELEAVVEGCQ